MYADFDFYKNSFFGKTISEEDYPHLSVLADGYVDYITRNKAQKYDKGNDVKMACCALAELYFVNEASKEEGAGKKSETVGSWSASYFSYAESCAQMSDQLYATARRYLANTGLLYRGRCF